MVDKVIKHKGGADKEADAMRKKVLEAKNELPERDGKIYYVSQSGDDNNDGLSPERPIKTYCHIQDLPLEEGDTVLLKRGDLFRTADKLDLISGVNYGAYGEGEKPKVYGSLRDYADASIWKQTEEENIWSTELKTPWGDNIRTQERASITTFNNEEYIGVWKYQKDQLKKDGDFCHDGENGIYYLYFSEGNPGEYFDNIEIATTKMAAKTEKTAGHIDIHVDNICYKFFTFGAFQVSEAINVKITNCELGFQGGRIYRTDPEFGHKLYGNAIQFWWQCKDCLVRNCWIYQIFDAAITFQGAGPEPTWFINIKFDYNLIEYCSMNIEYWAGRKDDPVPEHIEGISYKGNIIRFGGYGWPGIQRWDKHCQALLLGWNGIHEDLQDFVITDNILDCSDCNMIWMHGEDKHPGMSIYNNTYYQKPYSGTNKHIQILYFEKDSFANNQEELEKAVALFEKKPKLVKWLDI